MISFISARRFCKTAKLAAFLGGSASLLIAGPAAAATIPVSNLNDSGPGSLREAISVANSNGTSDLIDFGDALSGDIVLQSALPGLFGTVEIAGPGSAAVTITRAPAAGNFRILQNGGNNGVSGVENTAIIRDLRITGGSGDFGGGIFSSGTLTLDGVMVDGNAGTNGGGLFNQGTAVLIDTTVAGNAATGFGGGIGSSGSLTLSRSTVSGNTGAASAANIGGSLTVDSSTIANNTGQIGAISASSNSSLAIRNSTVANNGTRNISSLGPIAIRSSILANGGTQNCSSGSVLTSSGYNLIDDASCTLSGGTNDLTSTNPQLGALADNGGPTKTMAIVLASPALDAGSAGSEATDQRGTQRPYDVGVPNADDGTDIGAFELVAQDADGDRLADGDDACPQAASTAPNGCPQVTRILTIAYSKREERFRGKLTAGGVQQCVAGMEISVYLRKDGPDPLRGAATSDANGKWTLEARGREGARYKARTPAVQAAGVADCLAAKSATLKLK